MPTTDHTQHLADPARRRLRPGPPINAGVEAARLFLAVAVALFHWNWSLPNAYLAVDLFFVVSGLVVATRYEAELRAGGSLLNFAIGRAIRLYPLYLLGLAAGLCSALVEPLVTPEWTYSLADLVWRALLLVAVLDVSALPVGLQSFPLNNPAWSLWCEVLASGLFCLMCRTYRWLMLLPALLGGAVLLATALSGSVFSAGGDGVTVLVGLGRIGFSFFAGVLLLRLPRIVPLTGRPAAIALTVLFAALLTYFAIADTQHGDVFPVFVLLVGVFPLLTLCVSSCLLRGRLAQLCVLGGSLSYAVYILHWPLFRMARFALSKLDVPQADGGGLGLTVAVMLLMLAIAHLATRYVDRPVRRYLARGADRLWWERRGRTPAPQP